ncbi:MULTISPECIES: hypothetical protein [Frankia]|uniref:Transposase n=1 Tax=Frankia alni (strain DSM 45986 / CECT 9034 / ACN14a) TaxID=326424 RepID=Q0RM42_FRAAA|nr:MULTISPECIES: hypothetical protein [Frankia]CAJ61410.1 hypothetical protein FRAAL2766 [Frankia alni ACN14a]
MARRDTLTPDRQKTICDALRAGLFHATAAALAGVGDATLRRWLQRGREDLAAGRATKWATLAQDTARAEATAEVRWAGQIQTAAAAGDWRAGAWMLSHRFPARWSDKIDVTLGLEDGAFDEVVRQLADLVVDHVDPEAPNGQRGPAR